MEYLPILQELFGSDTVIFMVIGIVIAAIIGLRLKHQKHSIMAILLSIAAYASCEIGSSLHTNFMLELMLLFLGTASIGCCLGFTAWFFFYLLKSRKEEQ